MQWFYAIGEQRHGPVEQAEFDRLVAEGVIKPETLIWRHGMAGWQPHVTAIGGAGAPAVDDGTEVCAVSGRRFPRRDMVHHEGRWISAEHRDGYFQRRREGLAQPGGGVMPGAFGYGGFWRRFLARVVDGLCQAAIIVPLAVVGGVALGISGAARSGNTAGILLMQGLIQLFAIGFGILFDLFFIRKYDATPGKLAMGMKLLRADGSKLSIGRIIGRHLSHILSGLPLAIGYIMAGFDDQKRALHDRICDTRVIKTR